MDLNNREWAIVFWFFVTLGFINLNPKMKDVSKSLRQIFIVLRSRPILIVMALMSSYVILVILGLSRIGIWDWSQLKNTLIWFISVACLSLFNLDKYRDDELFYKEFCLSNLRLIVLIHFVLGIYTFSFLTELILIPLLVFLSALLAVAQTNKNHFEVEKLLTHILSFYGLSLVGYTFYMVISDFGSFANKSTVHDFLIPSLLTVFYLPFVYFMLVYSTYERVFIRLKFAIKDSELQNYAKRYALTKFHFRYKLLNRWVGSLVYLSIQSKADIKQSVYDLFSRVKIERSPPAIKTNRGWSPYEAMKFLKDEGVVAENYHPTYSDQWVARSAYIKTSEDMDLKNTVIYYVNGSSAIADCLELNLNISSLDSLAAGHKQLLYYAEALINKALDREITDDIRHAIMIGKSSAYQIGIYEVELKKEEWGNKTLGGYDLEFIIRLQSS